MQIKCRVNKYCATICKMSPGFILLYVVFPPRSTDLFIVNNKPVFQLIIDTKTNGIVCGV